MLLPSKSFDQGAILRSRGRLSQKSRNSLMSAMVTPVQTRPTRHQGKHQGVCIETKQGWSAPFAKVIARYNRVVTDADTLPATSGSSRPIDAAFSTILRIRFAWIKQTQGKCPSSEILLSTSDAYTFFTSTAPRQHLPAVIGHVCLVSSRSGCTSQFRHASKGERAALAWHTR
jgi:hypothetical protein